MKKFFLGLAAAATIGASPLWAQDGADLFEKLDANKDGVITSDEVPDDKQAIFERLVRVGDANGDKKLTKDELAAGLKKAAPQAEAAPAGRNQPGPPGGFQNVNPKEIFSRLDRDGNGKLEKDEIPERMKENLGRLDTNSDGVVELAEFEKVAQFFGGRRPDGAPGGAPEGRPGPGGPVPGGPVLRALDADGDGEISASEIEGATKALAKLDRNGDGKLTRDEIGPPGGRPEGQPAEAARPAAGGGAFAEQFLARLKEADKNGDGKISKDEAPERVKENFDRADRNSDGQLDESELKAMLERIRGAAGGGDAPRRRPGAEPKKD